MQRLTIKIGVAIAVAAACLLCPVTAQQQAKIVSPDPQAGEWFGQSVALDGDTALVGAYGENSLGARTGVAYVFVRNLGGDWTLQDTLRASDAALEDWFGWSVALDGDTAVVGAPLKNNQTGAAYVFTRSGSSWFETAILTAFDGVSNDRFGWSVSVLAKNVNAEYALVGAYGDNGLTGAAYRFRKPQGGSWSFNGKLTASDGAPGDEFGRAVHMNRSRGVVGAPEDDDGGTNSGSVYLFPTFGGSVTKLTAFDGAPGDEFGSSVSSDLFGISVVVGAWGDDDGGTDSGSVYVIESGTQSKLTAADAAPGDIFGTSVSMSGGTSSMSGDRVLVGAWGDDDRGSNSGSAYMFVRDGGGTWTQEDKLTATDGAPSDLFGSSVSLSGERALVGAYSDNDGATGAGSAYVFDAFATFGEGCPGSVGVPMLDAASVDDVPRIGGSFDVELSGLPIGAVTVGFFGASKTQSGGVPLPLDLTPLGLTNCTQWISLDSSETLSNINGTATWELTFLPLPSLIGQHFFVQGVVFDPGVNPAGMIVSNAGEGIIYP